jgi:hypothetical protein
MFRKIRSRREPVTPHIKTEMKQNRPDFIRPGRKSRRQPHPRRRHGSQRYKLSSLHENVPFFF